MGHPILNGELCSKTTFFYGESDNMQIRKLPMVNINMVCIGISTPPLKNATPSFLPSPPLNLQTVQGPLCRQAPPPLYSGTYTGCLGDRYTCLGAQTLMPNYHFSGFVLSVVFQQKIC